MNSNTSMDINEKVDKASRAIAQILAELEVETGGRIHGISIDTLDTTRVGDYCRNVLNSVSIDLQMFPVHRWAGVPSLPQQKG